MDMDELEGLMRESLLLEGPRNKSLPIYQTTDPTNLAAHTIFPRRLPDEDTSCNGLHKDMINLIRSAIRAYDTNLNSTMKLDISKLEAMFSKWTQFDKPGQLVLGKKIHESITDLKIAGDMMALYIEKQNAGLMLTVGKENCDSLILSVFQASCKSGVVMTCGDLIMDFPAKSIKIPRTRIVASAAFAQALATLTHQTFVISTPTTRKSGQSVSEMREVENPLLITEWILSLLADETSVSVESFPRIRKKIRDDVVLSKYLPFRRSGAWTTMKVAMQVSLLNSLDKEDAVFTYKCIMLLLFALEIKGYDAQADLWEQQSIDLLVQMMRKIARRMTKLNDFVSKYLPECQKSIACKNVLQCMVVEILEELNFKLSSNWKKYIQYTSKQCRVNEVDVKMDPKMLQQICPPIREEIERRVALLKKDAVNTKSAPPVPSCPNRVSTTEFPAILSNGFPHLKDTNLAEVENWVKMSMHNFRQTSDCHSIKSLLIDYAKESIGHYSGDPLGNSNMILTLLKGIKVLDEIAVARYPLYSEHNPGIDMECFSYLLVPLRANMEYVTELKEYFQRRQRSLPSLIQEQVPNLSSFSVRFAKQNLRMVKLRKQVLQHSEIQQEAKKEEACRVRNECNELQNKISCATHTQVLDSYYNFYKCSSWCLLCGYQSSLKHLRQSVSPYEKPLSDLEDNQYAVVFELLLLEEIGILRDMLYSFKTEILQQVSIMGGQIHNLWVSSQFVSQHASAYATTATIKLASTTKGFSETHYNSYFDVMSTSDEDFIRNNGFNHLFHGSSVLGSGIKAPKNRCTFQITQPTSPYCGMQWAVDSNGHTTNDVLSRQTECHQQLSIPEFVQFGFFRAGNRLQYRNLLVSLVNGHLSLKHEEVFILICQSLWELGREFGSSRETSQEHNDLLDDTFTRSLLELLSEKLENIQSKWSDPYVLCFLAVILSRIFEVSNLQEETAIILRRCRSIGDEWISVLKDLEAKAYNAEEKDRVVLKRSRVLAAMAVVITFWCSPQHIKFLITPGDVSIWMTAMSTLHNEIFWNYQQRVVVLGITPVQRTLLRLSISIGINLEGDISRAITSSHNCLDEFLSRSWRDFKERTTIWNHCDPHKQIYACSKVLDSTGVCHHVYVDVLFGRFLVDGYPIERLPEDIIHNSMYQRTFGKAEFFVQPSDATFGKIFSTTTEFKGRIYRFAIPVGLKGGVFIEEMFCDSNGVCQQMQLLPHTLLDTYFPYAFIHQFSHWWDPKRSVIQFRSKDFEDFARTDSNNAEYEWDLSSNIVKETLTDRELIYMKHPTWDKLTQPFACIEPLTYIHTWHTIKGQIEVELTRLALKFTIQDKTFCSRDFPGMHVDFYQNLDTLIGLKNKLVLKETMEQDLEGQRFVIVPHHDVNIIKSKQHQVVSVNLDTREQKEPPYFVYKTHKKRCLDAGKSQSAWLYLALLHGATSSVLEDPYTGMTGTEMSIQILNSARVYTNQAYDTQSKAILDKIEQFSPSRCFYPRHLKCQQNIKWPEGLSSMCANDVYRLKVESLQHQSNKLATLASGTGYVIDQQKIELTTRHFWRLSKFENPATIPELEGVPPPTVVILDSTPDENPNHRKVRTLSLLCEKWKSHLTSGTCDVSAVRRLLWTVDSLQLHQIPMHQWAIIHPEFSPNVENMAEAIRDNWFHLFIMAKNVGLTGNGESRAQWNLVLSSFAFLGVDFNILTLLQMVAVNSSYFDTIKLPTFSCLVSPTSRFSRSEVLSAIQRCAISFDGSRSLYTTDAKRLTAQTQHNNDVSRETEILVKAVEGQWIPRQVESISLPSYQVYKIDVRQAELLVNALIQKWYRNSKFEQFLEEFEAMCQSTMIQSSLHVRGFSTIVKLANYSQLSVPERKLQLLQVLENWTLSNIQSEVYDEAEIVYRQQKDERLDIRNYSAGHFDTEQDFARMYEEFGRRASTLMGHVETLSKSDTASHALIASGLYPRFVPLIILPILTENSAPAKLQSLIGATAVYWTLQQKMNRCVRYMNLGDNMTVAFKREKETEGLKCWSPREYPTWLLLEFELNMTIRPLQYKVAKNMLYPSNKANSVLQLNMGEGKTSLIVPMLASSIADGKQLCRVTVIKPIFETNVTYLRHTLGGLLNQRVYTIPYDRNKPSHKAAATTIGNCLKECLQRKGVNITLPEYRLSLKLKGLELARKGDGAAQSFLLLQKWLDGNTRDILDESDEILSVKYQLIYTVGDKVPVGGGNLRWEVAQKILKVLPELMRELKRKHGSSAVEYICESPEDIWDPSIFSYSRLLEPKAGVNLIDMVAEKFLNSGLIDFPALKSREKILVKKFLTNNDVTQKEINEVLKFPVLQDAKRDQDVLLILAGYLRFGVLETTLSKRWRVNYGVNPKGLRYMAVPFRAKDVASERTEFGHMDVAIFLTHLSYYYSGLRDDQILDCFSRLEKDKQINPAEEYLRWISNVPQDKIHKSVAAFDGVNLSDYEQRYQHLFPILRRSTNLINFWLSTFVFPQECRQFKEKVTCTAWDLVSESQALLTTGFSGTNDTKDTLPATISQNDLPELQSTNERVETILMSGENHYDRFPNEVTAESILLELKAKRIKVLLDCGALMLQLNNEGVANKWLDIDTSLQAVVFFNAKNVLTVKDRVMRRDCPFELSPFRDMMHKCGVYLDDEHTRGTDLKFPLYSMACVTLGSGLTRDKLVQACMRMRLLGQGHFVTFWASHEVHHKILAFGKLPVSAQLSGLDVLKWVKWNSEKFVEDGMVFWARSAVNYCQKLASCTIHSTECGDDKRLGEGCSENEVLKLDDMYSHAREKIRFMEIFPKWFKYSKTHVQEAFNVINATRTITSVFQPVEDKCTERLVEFIPEKLHFSQLLDEEQEKEMEQEKEQETLKENPPRATPLQHKISDLLIATLRDGEIKPNAAIWPVEQTFNNTIVQSMVQAGCWGNFTFCTDDFMKTVVVHTSKDGHTQFLRPVTWIAKLMTSDNNQPVFIIISPFEANELLPSFRNVQFKSVLHMINPRRLQNQNALIKNPSFALPSSTTPLVKLEWEKWLPPLFLCTGFLYLENEDEQSEYCKFLGIIPAPREECFQEFVDSDLINPRNGFVAHQHRSFKGCPIPLTTFAVNPEKLVTTICHIRNDSNFPEDSHVAKLVIRGTKATKF